jgi:hypothetical protein
MAPALLPEFDGALHHVISRRDAPREKTSSMTQVREAFLEIFGRSLIVFTGCSTPTA